MISITNFRDIGGIKNKNGHTVLSKTFLRSGEVTKVTKEDKEELETEYGLTKIIDLRSEAEVEERPDSTIPGTEYIHIDILENIHDEGATMSDFIKIGSPGKSMTYMQKLYTSIALDTVAQKGYARFFENIFALQKDESILFHCFAGKDRTGIAALLILEALNVSRELIYADYLLTNELRKKENALIIKEAKKMELELSNVEALEVALNVDRSYLDAFYQTIEKEYGDISLYLKQAIGLSDEKIAALQHKFLMEKE